MGTARTQQTPGRLAGVAALLSALALLASACGQADPAARLARAAEATTADETARFTIESELEGFDVAGGDLRSVGEGELDFSAQRTRITTSFEGPFGFETEMLIDEASGVSHVRVPEGLGDGWVRIDPAEAGLDLPGADPLSQASDPRSLLPWLEDLATDVEAVGEETVRGQPATRLRMTLDYVGALGEVDDEATRDILARHMTAMGMAEIAADVWVDEQDRVVRLTQQLDLGAADPAAMRELLAEQFDGFDGLDVPAEAEESFELSGSQSVTIEYYDFGADVDVEPPDEDEVLDLGDIDFGL